MIAQLSFSNEQDFDQFMLKSLPLFISINYKKYIEATTFEEKVRLALRVYELGLRALAMGTISQYLIRDVDRVNDESLNNLLLTKLPNATLTVWQNIFFQSLHAYHNKRSLFFMPELYDLYWDTSTDQHSPHTNVELPFNRLTQIRNELGPGGMSPSSRDEWEILYSEVSRLLKSIFSRFVFFANYELIRIKRRNGDLYWYDNFTGLEITTPDTPIQTTHQLHAGWFYLSKENREFLNLHPLLIFWEDPDSELAIMAPEGDTAVYDRLIYDRLQYLLTKLWATVGYDQSVTDFVRLIYYNIDQVKQKKLETDHLSWKDLQDVTKLISSQRMSSALGKYSSHLYLQREKTYTAFTDFLRSSKTCFVLTGKSGVGKSNFLLALANEYNWGYETDVCLLMYNGAKLGNQSLLELIEQDIFKHLQIHNTPPNKSSIWHEIDSILSINNKRFVVCIDAINENPNAKSLLAQVDLLIENSMWSWLKVLLTTRPEAWRTIKRGVHLSESKYYREPGNDKIGVEMEPFSYSQKLEPFTRDELTKAYQNYSSVYKLQTAYDSIDPEIKTILRDPLLLRLVSDIFQGQKIPTVIKPGEIYQLYLDHLIQSGRLIKEDLRFLEREIMPLMIRNDRYTNAVTNTDIDKAVTQEGIALFELIHGEGKLSDGRQVNQSYVNLVDAEILILHGDARDYEIGFKYERFYEHFGARRLFELAETHVDKHGFYQEVSDNIQRSQFIWGALKTSLILELMQGNSDLLTNLAITNNQTTREVLTAALIDYGKDEPIQVQNLLHALLNVAPEATFVSKIRRIAFWRTYDIPSEYKVAKSIAIEAASDLGQLPVLQKAAFDTSPSVRTIVIQYVYYLWKRNADDALSLLEALSHEVRGKFLIPNVPVVECCIGISASMIFDRYDDRVLQNKLHQVWKRIIGDLLFVKKNDQKPRRFASPRNWTRNVIVSLAISFVVRVVNEVTEDTMFTIPELKGHFEQDAAYRKIMGRIAPYIDPAFGSIYEIKDDLLAASNGYDFLTLITVWRILINHGVNNYEQTISLMDEILEYTTKNHPSGPYAQAMLNVLVFILEEKETLVESDFQKLSEYHQLIHKVNGFKFNLVHTPYRISYIDFYINLFYKKNHHLNSPYLTLFFDTVKRNKDSDFLVNLINNSLSSLRHLAITFEAPKLALEMLKHVLDYDDPAVQEAIIDMLARTKVYYPTLVEDFMYDTGLPESMILEIKHRQTSENAVMLIENKGYFFFNAITLQSDTFREEFIAALQSLPDYKKLSTWLKMVVRRVVNLAYGDKVFEI